MWLSACVGKNGKKFVGMSFFPILKSIFDNFLQQLLLWSLNFTCVCIQVMEQCVARLDVAMFNAILRESAHEIPTDPISDPIVDSKVLPIPAGDLSFGSGAQLKNSVCIIFPPPSTPHKKSLAKLFCTCTIFNLAIISMDPHTF